MQKSFTIGTFTAAQANAGIVLPRQIVPYKLKLLTISNPAEGLAVPSRLTIRDGAGQDLFIHRCGSSAGSEYHIYAMGYSGPGGADLSPSANLAYLPEITIDPDMTVTLENVGTEGFEKVTAILEHD